MKYSNYLLLCFLLLLAFIMHKQLHLSTNLLGTFASKSSLQYLDVANDLGYTKELFIAIKGFDGNSKRELKSIVKLLKKLKAIKSIRYTITPTKLLKNYYKNYYPLLANFNAQKLSQQHLNDTMKNLYNSQLQSFYSPINKNDPLGLFTLKKSFPTPNHRGKYLALGDYGYLIKVTTTVSPSQMQKAKKLYNTLHTILSQYKNVTAFAGFFYTVENSQKIKEDVTHILLFSTLLLFIIYLVMLRKISLLVHVSITLFSSIIFASLISMTIIQDFSALAFAFGASLSAVSIDYFFHYYFHNFFQSKKCYDKSVFFGFITTVIAFGILSFIPIPLIAQISIFSLLSLTYAYVVFTFLFPFLGIEAVHLPKQERSINGIKAWYITLLSVGLIIYALQNAHFDTNIKNLDYQNSKLLHAQELFSRANKEKLIPVLVEANTQATLLEHLHQLKQKDPTSLSLANFVPTQQECIKHKENLQRYDFVSLKHKLTYAAELSGFAPNYFQNSYKFVHKLPLCNDLNLSCFENLGLNILYKNKKVYSLAYVHNLDKVLSLAYVHNINSHSLFSTMVKSMMQSILTYGILIFVLVMLLLYISVKNRFIYALNYILFPFAISISIVTHFYELNIMHLFSLVILVAIGIDYGIYMSHSNRAYNTVLAINYSLLSTVAAFGVLLISSIHALSSIGLVISLGIGSIYFLTRFMR